MEQAIQETIKDEELPPTDTEEHHYISKTRQTPLNLLKWVKDHANDPAIKGQWYGLDDDAKSGFAAKHCYQIGFIKGEDAFGFVNPADILCAVHLIPQFVGSHTNALLASSMAQCMDEENLDYEQYYVEMFVDLLFDSLEVVLDTTQQKMQHTSSNKI
ncbi:hypothetical protein C0995_010113 [Termitomyces sp. Mi166|nr:hypothetical protein C0995_010113 [Termitomyces sp. Mi166\